jgi:hypothetical protein
MPNKIPWRIHFGLTDSLEITSQKVHSAHINEEAEALKSKEANEILLKIKIDNPKIFEEMVKQRVPPKDRKTNYRGDMFIGTYCGLL